MSGPGKVLVAIHGYRFGDWGAHRSIDVGHDEEDVWRVTWCRLDAHCGMAATRLVEREEAVDIARLLNERGIDASPTKTNGGPTSELRWLVESVVAEVLDGNASGADGDIPELESCPRASAES